jgi:hypothetical protein
MFKMTSSRPTTPQQNLPMNVIIRADNIPLLTVAEFAVAYENIKEFHICNAGTVETTLPETYLEHFNLVILENLPAGLFNNFHYPCAFFPYEDAPNYPAFFNNVWQMCNSQNPSYIIIRHCQRTQVNRHSLKNLNYVELNPDLILIPKQQNLPIEKLISQISCDQPLINALNKLIKLHSEINKLPFNEWMLSALRYCTSYDSLPVCFKLPEKAFRQAAFAILSNRQLHQVAISDVHIKNHDLREKILQMGEINNEYRLHAINHLKYFMLEIYGNNVATNDDYELLHQNYITLLALDKVTTYFVAERFKIETSNNYCFDAFKDIEEYIKSAYLSFEFLTANNPGFRMINIKINLDALNSLIIKNPVLFGSTQTALGYEENSLTLFINNFKQHIDAFTPENTEADIPEELMQERDITENYYLPARINSFLLAPVNPKMGNIAVLGCGRTPKLHVCQTLHQDQNKFFTIDKNQDTNPHLVMDFTSACLPENLHSQFVITILDHLPHKDYMHDYQQARTYIPDSYSRERGAETRAFENVCNMTNKEGFIIIRGSERSQQFRHGFKKIQYVELTPNAILIPRKTSLSIEELRLQMQAGDLYQCISNIILACHPNYNVKATIKKFTYMTKTAKEYNFQTASTLKTEHVENNEEIVRALASAPESIKANKLIQKIAALRFDINNADRQVAINEVKYLASVVCKNHYAPESEPYREMQSAFGMLNFLDDFSYYFIETCKNFNPIHPHNLTALTDIGITINNAFISFNLRANFNEYLKRMREDFNVLKTNVAALTAEAALGRFFQGGNLSGFIQHMIVYIRSTLPNEIHTYGSNNMLIESKTVTPTPAPRPK